jgi:hypothetical protein
MKQISLLLALAFSIVSNAQPFVVPNSGFENWNSSSAWSEPDQYATGNNYCIIFGLESNVTKITNAHGGQFAAELSTQSDGINEAFPGIIAIGPFGYDAAPYADFQDRPDSIEFFAMNQIADGDIAGIYFEFRALGNLIGSCELQITGTEDNYVRYAMPVIYTDDAQPDQMGMFAVNTNFNNPSMESVMSIDDIHFIYNETTGADMPNGDFESWTDYSISSPDGWATSNSYSIPTPGVTADPNAYEGDFSCRIENVYSEFTEEYISFIFLGDILNEECSDLDVQYPDGNTIPSQVNFHYKYECDNPEDSASLYFFARRVNFKSGECDSVFESAMYLPPVSQWTEVTYSLPSELYAEWLNIFINGMDPVSNVSIAFAPGEVPIGQEDGVESTPGAVLWIDNVSIINDFFASVDENVRHEIKAYPNPGRDVINIELPSGQHSATAELRDITGKLVFSENCRGSITQMNTSALSEGTYTLDVYNEQFRSNKLVVISK